jgi:LPXTG-motif cell wall-anchored protein
VITSTSLDAATAWVIWIGGALALLLALYVTRRQAGKPSDKR